MKLKFIEEKSEIREFKTGDWVYDTIQPFSIGAIYLVIENKRLARLTTGFVSEKSYYKYTDSDFRLLTDADNNEFKEDFSAMMFGVVKEIINRGIDAQR